MTDAIDLGGISLEVLTDGDFFLDGGAMFGSVPKVLWERVRPCDARNRIRLGLRPVLVRAAGRIALVETGMGSKWSAKEADIWGLTRDVVVGPGPAPVQAAVVGWTAANNTWSHLDLPTALERRGVSVQDVDLVIQTHLHFDHVGGATRREGDRCVPVFPRARHVVQAGEWHAALHPTARNRASYLSDSFLPLEDAGLLDLVDGDVELLPGVRLVRTPGHTWFHQSVLIQGRERTAILWGDLIPTRAHVPAPWIMGYDLYPASTLSGKETWLPRAAEEGWISIWYHEAFSPVGRVVRTEKGYGAADL